MAIVMPTVVDDNGTGTTGTILDLAKWTALGAAIDAAIALGGGVQTSASVGVVADFALTAGVTLLTLTNASLLQLTGIAAGVDGQRLTIVFQRETERKR